MNGHPVRHHKGKQHSLSKKAKINANSHVVKKNKQNKKSYFFPGHPAANVGSQEDAKKKGTIRISGEILLRFIGAEPQKHFELTDIIREPKLQKFI